MLRLFSAIACAACFAFAAAIAAHAQQAINQSPPAPGSATTQVPAPEPEAAPPCAAANDPRPECAAVPKPPAGGDAVDTAAAEIQGMAPDLSKLEGLNLQKVMEMAKGLGLGSTPGQAAGGAAGAAALIGQAGGAIQKLQQLAFDKEVQAALGKMIATPNRFTLLIYEVVFLVMMFFLKNYELSRLEKGQFLKRVWIAVWSTVLNFLGLAFLIPFIFFGQPFLDLLRAGWRILGQ